MRRTPMLLGTFAAAALLAFACSSPEVDETATAEPAVEAGASDEAVDGPAVSQLSLDDFTLHIPEPSAQAKVDCTEPKPSEGPCTTCKPCILWRCVDGEWRPSELDWGILCEPPVPDDGPSDGLVKCPRSPSGFCSPQCDICF